MPDPGDLDKVLAGFRRSLLKSERGAASQMVRYYGEAWQRIRAEVIRLTNDYNALILRGENAEATLLQLRRMREIKGQVEKELAKFAGYAGNTIQRQEAEAIRAASRDALKLVQASFWPAPSVDMAFNRLSPSAIENMIATFQVGSPVHARLLELAGTGAQAVQDGLTQGLMLGQNANTIARQIRLALGSSLAKALTWSRTETMRAYRGASLATYQANANVLGGWTWRSARNTRTCAMCWAMDGTVHELSEPLDDHPNGRCFAVPVPKTWDELGISGMPPARPPRMTGSEAFARLSEAEKLKILGPAKYAAYKDGAIKLEDLVGRRLDPRWGSMRYEKSLAELGIDWKKYAGVSIAPAAGATAPDLLAIARPARYFQRRGLYFSVSW